jgi:hypothetical protein
MTRGSSYLIVDKGSLGEGHSGQPLLMGCLQGCLEGLGAVLNVAECLGLFLSSDLLSENGDETPRSADPKTNTLHVSV